MAEEVKKPAAAKAAPKAEAPKKDAPKAESKGTVEVKGAPRAPRAGGKPGDKGGNARDSKGGNRRGGNRKGGKRFERRPSEFEEKLIDVARVTTVVKGGRRFSFSVVVVIGNKKGKVGYGHGKANEVPDAIKKAVKDAQRNIIEVPIINGTVPHIHKGKFVSSNVLLKPAAKGKGLIASGSVRAVVELAGYTDIVTKSLGSNNKANVVKATIETLKGMRRAEDVAKLRDVSVESLKTMVGNK